MSRKAEARGMLPRGGNVCDYEYYDDVQVELHDDADNSRGGGGGGGGGGGRNAQGPPTSQQQQQQTQNSRNGNRQQHQQQQRRNKQRRGHGQHQRNRRTGGSNGADYGAISLAFTREDFVKANFGFCLHPQTTSSSLRGQDSLEWDEVESVSVKSDEPVVCPLCLDQVRAPRITTCGHIFCCVCMYRLFMHASNTWEHCPLCQSFICEKDLRRISSIEIIPKVAVGDQIDLILLTRPRAGIVPVALESKGGDFAQRRLPSVHTRRATFSRFAIETKENVTRVGERDLNDLRYLMNEAQAFNDSFGSELIKRAYANVSGTMQRWAAPKAQESSHDSRSTVPISRAGANAATGSSSAGTTGGRRGGGGGGGSSAVGKLDQPEEDVQFYQIADARYVFLDSFVVKCLAHQFGADKTQFPPRLEKVRVVNVENIVLTPEVVKRNSYLVHVPIHANLYLVEIDLQEILSAETLEVFREEIASRARRRAAKLKAERRHEKQLSEKLKRMSLRGPLESNLGYSIDYRQYMEQRKRQEEQIQRELAHAFEASLTGDMVSEEEINAMLDSASAQQSNGIWGSAPQHIGSFASIVNSQSHFPELSSSPPTTNLSTSPQSSYSLSSSPGAGNGLSSTASKTGWATLSAPKPPTTSQHARTLVPSGLAPGTGATSAESGPSQAPQGAQGAAPQEARSKGKNKSKNNKKAVLLSTAGRRGR